MWWRKAAGSGANVVITLGLQIGKQSVVAGSSVVTKGYPAVFGGCGQPGAGW
ncbi:MAG: hypothetical protein R3B47_11945 [Bacteroidia bacterium]